MRREEIVQRAVDELSAAHPGMFVSITAGADGSWVWDGARLVHAPIYNAQVRSTAGAGDAHLSGIVAGLAAGLRWRRPSAWGRSSGRCR